MSICVIKHSKKCDLDEWEGGEGWEGLRFRGLWPMAKCLPNPQSRPFFSSFPFPTVTLPGD